MKRLIVAGAAMAVALSGCATAYQSKGFSGGFSETLLASDMFKIDFSGNGYTSAERSSDFAMLRAADKSLELGCNYFGILNEADSASVGSMTVAQGGWGHRSAWGFSSTVPIVKPNSNLLVKCFKDKAPGNTFDAHFIAQSIRGKYGIKAVEQSSVRSSPERPQPVTTTDGHRDTERPSMPAVPAADPATTVLAAQRVAQQQGCGDVHSAGNSTFEAVCTSFRIVIDCNGDSCRPIRAINN
jgi:hypothetical protein